MFSLKIFIVITMISSSIKIPKPTPASITQGKMHNSKPSWAWRNRLQTSRMMNNKESAAPLLTLSLISEGAEPAVRASICTERAPLLKTVAVWNGLGLQPWAAGCCCQVELHLRAAVFSFSSCSSWAPSKYMLIGSTQSMNSYLTH